MANRLNYFAYGSNMNQARMDERCPKAMKVGHFKLENYELCFPRRSTRQWPGSGVASVRKKEGQNVEGVLYELTPTEFKHLSKLEGQLNYKVEKVLVKSVQNPRRKMRSRSAHIFIADPELGGSFDPAPEYLELIESGAKKNRLSKTYLEYLARLRNKALERRQQRDTTIQTTGWELTGTVEKRTCSECAQELAKDTRCADHPKASVHVDAISRIQINKIRWKVAPLQFYLAEPLIDPVKDPEKPNATERDVLRFLCRDSLNITVDGFIQRYRKIGKCESDIPVMPDDDAITQKIVDPMLEAKTSYMLGNYFSVITLCGMICEVLTVLLFEMRPLQKNGTQLSDSDQKSLLGDKIENLTQERRIELLKVTLLINESVAQDFHDVRNTRNNYVHMAANSVTGKRTDAERLYIKTAKLIHSIFGLEKRPDGNYNMDKSVMSYLEKKHKGS